MPPRSPAPGRELAAPGRETGERWRGSTPRCTCPSRSAHRMPGRCAACVRRKRPGHATCRTSGRARSGHRSSRIERCRRRCCLTDSDEANELLAREPLALPDRVRARPAGEFDCVRRPAEAAGPARRPRRRHDRRARSGEGRGSVSQAARRPESRRAMAKRVQELCAVVVEDYDGDAARIWTEASDGSDLRSNERGCPASGGDEDRGARLGRGARWGVEAARVWIPIARACGRMNRPMRSLVPRPPKRARGAPSRADAACQIRPWRAPAAGPGGEGRVDPLAELASHLRAGEGDSSRPPSRGRAALP